MTATMPPTSSQTVGPFYGYALPFPGGGDMAPAGSADAILLHGCVYDGEGTPIPDALIELWQADPEGNFPAVPGSLRRNPVNGGFYGRNGVDFTGFGRVPTGQDGRWATQTLRPGARPGRAPYISLCVFARGLLMHLFTRMYFPENAEANAADPLLAALPPDRRRTLIAAAGPDGTYRFDIRLQHDGAHEETVFLDFR
jgi:protocatechuate 3,4-dioxygenase alpha subunit